MPQPLAKKKQTDLSGRPHVVDRGMLPVGLLLILGINTGSGKTSLSKVIEAYFASASVQVRMLRIETGERRNEFRPTDLFIDINRAGDAANLVGGSAGLLDEVWGDMSETIKKQGVVVADCGAGAQNFLLPAAAMAGLDDLITELGAGCGIIVVTTPDAECGRQAVKLVSDARAAMASAQILLAINHVNAAQHAGLDSPAQRAFVESIAGLEEVPRIDIPFARAHAIDCFKAASILEIMDARDEKLMLWSGKGQLSSRAAQTHLAAWYRAVSDRLQVLWP
jgi:hypothetical protein